MTHLHFASLAYISLDSFTFAKLVRQVPTTVDKSNESVDKSNETVDKSNESVDKSNESVDKSNETVDKSNETVDKSNEQCTQAVFTFMTHLIPHTQHFT